jgi:hypothetical protein
MTIPCLVLQPGLKKPVPNPHSGGWWVLNDPDQAAQSLTSRENLAILLGVEKESPVIAVGLDLYRDPEVLGFAQGLGVTSSAACWVMRTGRGGIALVYADPRWWGGGPTLTRDTTQQGRSLDLLVNGYQLVPPSVTQAAYRWYPGHSPGELPLTDLEPPPAALLRWWAGLHESTPHSKAYHSPATLPPRYSGPIPEGARNVGLTRRAGYLHRLIPNDSLVRDLVMAINQRDCQPPLPESEVEAILSSILPREGAGHFRIVLPLPMGGDDAV